MIFPVFSQEFPEKLSENAVISLVNVGYDDFSRSFFSKSALRFYDAENNFDILLDFSHFDDFDDDFFPLKFFFSPKKAKIVPVPYLQFFFTETKKRNAKISESVLKISSEQVAYIFDFVKILHSALPDYEYEFDILENNSESHIAKILNDAKKMYEKGLLGKIPKDFSPTSPFDEISEASVFYSRIGKDFVLNAKKEIFPLKNAKPNQERFFKNPILIIFFSAVAFIFFLLTCYQIFTIFFPKIFLNSVFKTAQVLDFLIFFLAGLSGSIILFQDIFSNQTLFQNNFQFLFLFPLHFVAAFTFFFDFRFTKVKIIYWSATTALSFFYILTLAIILRTFPLTTFLLAFPLFFSTAYFDFLAIKDFLPKR